jgi:transposase InsO family protein
LLTADAIFALILKGHIFCDLRHHFLGNTNTALLFPDALIGQACLFRLESTSKPERSDEFDLAVGNKLQLYQNRIFDILERKDSFIILRTPDGKTIEMDEQNLVDLWKQGQACSISQLPNENGIDDPFNRASKKALEEANSRYYLIQDEQTDSLHRVPVATLNRWKARARLSEKKYGNRHSGLIPLHSRKGNHRPRYEKWFCDLCQAAIKKYYSNADAPLVQTAYGQFCLVCQEKGITPPSMKWFSKQIKMRPKSELENDRRGSRAGYAATLFVYNLNGTTPPQGDHPWDICHIDHTQLDLENIDEIYGTNLGRPWLTLLISAYSRKVLAYSLSFDPPSTTSCMLVLSDCVKKHNRLPSTVVVDWGREFESIGFEVLLARNYINKKVRPPHEARNGAVLERFFGVTNEQLIHNLKGNTKIMKNPRLATKSVSPAGRAVWTLPATHELLGDFFEQFHNTPHSTLSTTPNHFHQVNLDRLGARGHRYIKYDEPFRRSTMIRADKPRVVRPTGVRINHDDYWCPAFTNPKVQGSNVEVCYSAQDVRTCLALVNGVWETCKSVHYDFLEPLSEKALELATKEILKKRKLTASGKKISALELAAFIKSAKSKEVELQRRKDQALEAALDEELLHTSLSARSVEPPTEQPVNEKPASEDDQDDDDSVQPCGSETNE